VHAVTTRAFWLIVHALAAIVFANRYVGGMLLRLARGTKWDETVDDFVPTVTVVIPLYNEGAAIRETLDSVLASEYPHDKLRVTCVDDCSSDDSYDVAREVARRDPRLTVIRNPKNVGKRASINHAVRRSDSEIIVSVDSDVVVDRRAIRELVRRFTRPEIAAVGGWVDVRNKHDNWLTRMQSVQYWYAYYVTRNIEQALRRVMCLSGCLSAYRRSVLVELAPILENRSVLGVPIKYGEDRFLTRQVIKAGYLTVATLDAHCWTFVPRTLDAYFSQQLRWRRSRIIDYSCACSHVWRLHPILAIHFFSLAIVLLVYPVAVYRLLASGAFLRTVVLHLSVVTMFGAFYRWRVRRWPRHERVGAFAYAPIALVLPVTFALLTPLALFTLDSTNWETRKRAISAAPAAEPPP
jgi:cellulose synthase/poly-beta-1,6-N-acetylglucosamine synthase-like glycosyltransferase